MIKYVKLQNIYTKTKRGAKKTLKIEQLNILRGGIYLSILIKQQQKSSPLFIFFT